MATNLNYNLNLNTKQGYKNITDLYNYGQNVFNKGFNVKLGGKGSTLPLGKITGDFKQFNGAIDAATDRVVAFTATTSLIYATGRALQRLVGDAIAVETAITSIQSILGATNSDLSKFTASVFDLANKTGVGFLDAAKAAEEFARQGLSLEKTLSATQAALGVFRVSGGDIVKIIEGLTSSVNSFANEGIGFQEVADKLAALDAKFATSATGLIEGLKRVGATAQEAGISFDELGALIASVRQISGRTEAVIGNGLKTIVTNLQNAGIQERIEAIGVAVRDAGGEFRPVIDVIRDLSTAFQGLTDSQQAELGTKIAGKFQINTFKSLLQATRQGGFFETGLETSQGADGDIKKRLEVLNETTQTAIQQFQNSITRLGSTLGDSVGKEFVDKLLNYGDVAITRLADLFTKGNPIGEALSSGLSNALSGPGFVLVGAIAGQLGKRITLGIIEATKSITNINSVVQNQLSLQQQINAALTQGNTIYAQRQRIVNGISVAEYKKRQREAIGARNTASFLESPNKFFGTDRNTREQASRFGVSTQSAAFAQKQKEARDSRRNKAIGAGFGVSFLGGAAASLLPESQAKDIVNSVTTALGTALVGASFGPLGVAIGAVVGGLGILSTVTDRLYNNLDSVNNVVRNNIAENEKQAAAGQEYIESLEKLKKANESGTPQQRITAQNEASQLGSRLRGGNRSLLGATTDTERLDILERERRRVSSSNAGQLAISSAEKLVKEAFKDFGQQFDGLIGVNAPSLSRGGLDNVKEVSSGITDTIDLTKVNLDELNKRISGVATNPEGLQNYVKNLIDDTGAKEALQRVAEVFKDGESSILSRIGAEISIRKTTEELSKSQQSLLKNTQSLDKSFRDIFTRAAKENSRANSQTLFGLERQVGLASLAGEGLQGDQALDFSKALSILEIETAAVAEKFQVLGNFTPKVLEAITSGTEGVEDRQAALKVVSEFVKGSLSAVDLQPELVKLLGADKAAGIFRQLEGVSGELRDSFSDIDSTLKNDLIRSADKASAALTKLNFEKLSTLFGDITQDPKEIVDTIVKGQKATRETSPFNETQGLQKGIATLQGFRAEKELGLLSQRDIQDRVPELTKAISSILDARRVEIGSPQLQGFLGADKTISKDLAKEIQSAFNSGDFTKIFKSLDKNGIDLSKDTPLLSFIKKEARISNDINGATSARVQLETGLSSDEQAVEQLKTANDLLGSIKVNTENQGKAATSAAISSDALLKRYQEEDNQKKIGNSIKALGTEQLTLQQRLGASGRGFSNFESNLKTLTVNPDDTFNSPSQTILPSEAERLRNIAQTPNLDMGKALTNAIIKEFGSSRASEIIGTGAVDPLRKVVNPESDRQRIKELERQIQDRNVELRKSEKRAEDVVKPQQDKTSQSLDNLTSTLSNGISATLTNNVTANVTVGGSVIPDYTDPAFNAYLQEKIKAAYVEYGKQNGQNPTITPTTPPAPNP